jgi:hypothetical protein
VSPGYSGLPENFANGSRSIRRSILAPAARGSRIVREIVCPCVAARIQPKSEVRYTLWASEYLELRFRGYLK